MTKIRTALILTFVITAGAMAGYATTHRLPGTVAALLLS